MTLPAEKKIRIAIIGGGISGLALAAGLVKKPHIDFTIYESVPEYRDVGAGLALHLNAIKAMALIGDEVRQAYFDSALNMGEEDMELATQVILAHGPHSGDVVAELGRAKGRKTVARYELMKAFQKLLPADRVQFGKRAEGIQELDDDTLRIRFTDGSEATADCVLGGDGVHSITRGYILGADHPAVGAKNREGYQNYRRMMTMDKAKEYGMDEKWAVLVSIFCGPRGNINSMPLDRGQRLSVGIAIPGLRYEADQYGGAPPLRASDYDDYHPEARQMVQMIADETNGSWSYADHDHAPTFFRGRVAAFGDSAHCMTPFAGNGAAQALEDCAVLDSLFSKVKDVSQVEKAFAAYDTIRRPRSQAIVDLSRKFGRAYNYNEEGLRDSPEAMRKFFKEAAFFTNNVDMAKQNDDAMKLFESSL